MALTGKKKEAAEAIAAANPTWSKRHVEICADFLMPTTTAWCFDKGTKERVAAEQHFTERMHAFLVEMNIIKPEQAYVRPDDWKSPYEGSAPKAQRKRATETTAAAHTATPAATGEKAAPKAPSAVSNEIREPKAGSAGGLAWAVCDAFYAQHQRAPTASEARAAGEAAGLNPGNVGTEASRWRKFRGYRQ